MVTSMLTGVVWTFGACHTFFIVLPFGCGLPAGYRLITDRDRSSRPATFGRHRHPLWRREAAGRGRLGCGGCRYRGLLLAGGPGEKRGRGGQLGQAERAAGGLQ